MSDDKEKQTKQVPTKINPLEIKDANKVMTHLTLNIAILYFLVQFKNEFGVLYPFVYWISIICIILGLVFGIIICLGWLVAIATKHVIYIEIKPKKKGMPYGDDNHKLP